MQDGHLLKTAVELVEALNKVADENLPRQLAGIVKLHSGLAVASAFIPIPGADMAATAANIWAMYVRINKELALPFGENILKSVAAGVATNLARAAATALVVGSVIKFFPGIGTVAGAAVMAGTTYAVTLASGIVYMKALTKLANRGVSSDTATESDVKAATDEVLKDKAAVDAALKEGRSTYANEKKST